MKNPNEDPIPIDPLLKRQRDLEQRLKKTTLPDAPDSVAVQRQFLDALSAGLLQQEERSTKLQDALTQLPSKVESTVDERMEIHLGKINALLETKAEAIQDSIPKYDEVRIRQLVHAYGILILAALLMGTLTILLR